MNRYALLLLAAPLLGGCPSDPKNPAKLWLFLDGAVTEVKLVDFEPEPF